MKTEYKNKTANDLFDEALKNIQSGASLDGALGPLIKKLAEASLEGELDAHLNSPKENENRRNGKNTKTVRTHQGNLEITTPRDRNSSFEPKLIPKRKTILNEAFDDKVLSMVAIGTSYGDITKHFEEVYGIEVSKATITSITDKVIPALREWQGRQLEEVYPVVWLDAFVLKVREEGFVRKKSAYCVLGINHEGHKELLGVYLNETEGAKFWLQVLTDLKNRGVKDIFIACIDGLKGFPDAIESVFPETEVQLCVIHQIRNSLKYVTWKDQKAFMRDLKLVYKATNKELAEKKLDDLDDKWGSKYHLVLKSWRTNWDRLSAYFAYPEEIRRIIYTTNTVEGFHRQMRKVIKTKAAFPNQDSFLKLAYLAINMITKNWNRPVHNWNRIHAQLSIRFEGRLPLKLL